MTCYVQVQMVALTDMTVVYKDGMRHVHTHTCVSGEISSGEKATGKAELEINFIIIILLCSDKM